MKLELRKVNGKTVGYSLVPENENEQFALNDIRNHHFFGIEETAIRYNGIKTFKENGVEMVTRMDFVQGKYRDDGNAERKIKQIPIYSNDTPVDMIRKECFAIVRDEIKCHYDQELMGTLMNLSLKHKELPVAPLVLQTYLGIIGYHKWLKEEEKCPISFVGDALHDLSGCLQYNRNDGYSPRTYEFIPNYK